MFSLLFSYAVTFINIIIEINNIIPIINLIIVSFSKFLLTKNEIKIGITNNNPSYLVKPANAAKNKRYSRKILIP